MFAFQAIEFAAIPPFDFASQSRHLQTTILHSTISQDFIMTQRRIGTFRTKGLFRVLLLNLFQYHRPHTPNRVAVLLLNLLVSFSFSSWGLGKFSNLFQADGLCQSIKVRQQQLLQARELFGDVISSRKRKLSFQAEYEKKHASQPLIRSGHSSSAVSMPSSICCLASLKLWDHYFLASSMDGSIKLYDHRLTHRGPVQSYEGNVNSHTRIELGIDPSEKVVMSGGEDCYIRLWNIKSGELLFKDRFMNTIPSTVCWPRIGGLLELTKDGQDHRCYWQDHSLGAWLGSYEGVFYMDWL
ncbi:hypothetical protein Sango_1432900 [Sesamum angolense]|uniref:Uncharacterized protein n=1 Tax=Sesamum angolense TaxID=2727404 RepID=A0AAE2BVR5_9LAMI|nr:hypothetical protein Sango_1432900 [Sesamum angolense]